jgi:hypothetical protein
MKKFNIIAVILIFALFVSCTKNNPPSSGNSLIGKWVYLGGYVNNKVLIQSVTSGSVKEIDFNQDSTYVINSQVQDSSEYGNYSTGHGSEPVGVVGMSSFDSILFHPTIAYVMNQLPPSYLMYYVIQKDTLFLFGRPSETEYVIPSIYIKAN